MAGKLNKILAGVIALCVICSGAVSASGTVDVSEKDGVVTVEVKSLGSGEETTLLVVPEGTSVSEAFANTSKIYHLDQSTASSAGVATFEFKYTGTGNLNIYSGYATMDADDEPLDEVLDLSGSAGGGTGGEPDGEFTYGDVNNDGKINILDASAVINYILRGTAFTDSTTVNKEEYVYGVSAADVDGNTKINVLDASAIINYILRGTEFPAVKNNN